MRMIPKNTRISSKVWKSYSLLDVILAFGLFLIAAAIFMSNLPNKIIILFIFCFVSVALMFGSQDDVRLYMEIIQIFKYITSPKVYDEKHKKNSIDKLVPYSNFEDNGTINYGEYYGKVISIGSIEFRLLDEWAQNSKISMFSQLMNSLTPDQSMQIVKIDRPINFDVISGNIFDKLDDDASGNEIKREILKSRIAQIDNINNIEKQYRPYYYIVLYDNEVQSLRSTVDMALSIVCEIGLEAHSLSLKETIVFLKYCNTRNFDERGINDVAPEDYLNYVRPKSVKYSMAAMQIDDVKAFSYAVSDFPLNVSNAWGAGIFNINNTKVVLNIKPLDREKATKRVDRAFSEVASQEEGKASKIISQNTHIETMGALLQSMENENESMFDCTLTVTAYKNNSEQSEGELRKLLRQKIVTSGFKINQLICRQMEAYISSNITRRNALKRYDRGINSESLAAVFPFVFTSIIDPDGITLGVNSYPVILDIHKRGDKYTNSNMMVIGKPGGGKSYFVKMLLGNIYSENTKIFVLDPENEYGTLAKSVNGSVIDAGNALTGKLNPFHIFDILTDDGTPAPPDAVYKAHLRFLESFFEVTLPGIHPDTLELLNNIVVKCYEEKGIDGTISCAKLTADKYPIFDDLMQLVKKQMSEEPNAILKTNLQRAETYLTKFATGGRNSYLWNGASTLTSSERLTVFNFQSLLAGKNSVVANGQMLLMLRFLEQQVINAREKNRNQKDMLHPIVALDEGYMFVNPEYPVMLDFVYQWFKRIRKYSGSMIMITQNVQDLVGNAQIASKTATILSNTQYHFIFPLAPGDVNDLATVYSGAGEINDTEKYEIANNARGTAFLISAPGERSSLRIIASDYVESLFIDKVSKTA